MAAPVDVKALPQDPAILRQMVAEALATVERQKAQIEKLQHWLDQLRRRYFGPRSERVEEGQMIFEFVQFVEEPPPKEPVAPPKEPSKEGKKPHGRRIVAADIPRKTIVRDLSEDQKECGKCHKPLRQIGEETSEQLEYQPASLFVTRSVRPKYVCVNSECEGTGVVTAELPVLPVAKGMAGPGLLAHVVVSKYQDHLPLYRQEHIFARHGVLLGRSTLCDWVGEVAELVEPIWREQKQEVFRSKHVRTDDTPVAVLEPGTGKTRTGRLWVYVGDEAHREVVYEWSPTREQEYPQAHFGEYEGYVQADAYKGYDELFRDGKRKEVGCWAHARRYFFDAIQTDSERALVALGYIRELYQIERELAEAQAKAAERLSGRQERAKPILEAFWRWLKEQEGQVLPKSPMGEAITYALNQWVALCRYTEDGDLSIDNGEAERRLRPIAVGRNNWLFAGSDEGGRRAAILYGLIESAKRNGIDPFEYLRDVIERIATHKQNAVAELMPSRWKARVPPADTS